MIGLKINPSPSSEEISISSYVKSSTNSNDAKGLNVISIFASASL